MPWLRGQSGMLVVASDAQGGLDLLDVVRRDRAGREVKCVVDRVLVAIACDILFVEEDLRSAQSGDEPVFRALDCREVR